MKFVKFLGAGFGWVLGGPIGAILGFALGAFIDNVEFSSSRSGQGIQTGTGDFVASLLVLTAAVMKADGRIMKSELDFVKTFFVRQFGPEKTREYMLLLKKILERDIPLQDVCVQVRTHMDYHSRLLLLQYLFGVASASDTVDVNELNTLKFIARHLGIAAGDFESVRAMFGRRSGPSADDAYRILEVDSKATDEEVKKAYRRLAQMYHPDKVNSLGPEHQEAAKAKFQKLNEAYERIKSVRGMN